MRQVGSGHDDASVGNRRSFLRKAGVAAGAAWVAPTVLSLSSPAAAASSPPLLISVPFFPMVEPQALTICGSPGALRLEPLGPPPPPNWQLLIQSLVPIEIVALGLHGTQIGTLQIQTPTFPPPITVGPPLNVSGIGAPSGPDSFFDIFYTCGP